MLKRPKDKGTRFETFVTSVLLGYGLEAKRMPASSRYDIGVRGSTGKTIEVLVAKENNGKALATIPLSDFAHLLQQHGDNAHIECKHLARIALHGIYQSKFGDVR